jgi:four helix bundle protein
MQQGETGIRDFRKIKAWEKAHALTLATYAVTERFPAAERFGLTAQVRRCAASIGANIAEGCGRPGEIELTRFLAIALGSASELEYHLLLARDLGYLPEARHGELSLATNEVKRMLHAFIDTVRVPRGR